MNETTSPVRSFLKAKQDEWIRFITDLCGFDTINPPGQRFQDCASFLSDSCRAMGFQAEVLPVPKAYQEKYAPRETLGYNRMNVIARWDIGAAKTLHFNSHFDVVPVSDGWSTPPFTVTRKKNRLYARGTQDMKGCLASSLYAIHALKECGLTPGWNIELSFVCDEEIGGLCGAGYITGEGVVKPDAVIVCEGGSGGTVAYGHRGVYWGDVRIQGKAGHGSNPKLGHNAFEAGIEFTQALQQLHKKHLKRKTSERMASREFRSPTMTMGGMAGGGSKVNIIPPDFHFTFDRRLIAEESVKNLNEEYQKLAKAFSKKHKPISVAVSPIMSFDAGYSDPQSWFCKTARSIVSSVRGEKAKLRMFGAFTDLHFFTNRCQCPGIGYGVEGAGLHSSDEFLSIPSFIDTACVYAGIALTPPKEA